MTKELEIGGELRPFSFGINSREAFCLMRGLTQKELQALFGNIEEMTDAELRDLIFSCLKSGYRCEGKDMDFNNETVGDWIDNDPEAVLNALVLIAESASKKKMTKEVAKEQEKSLATTT